MTNHDEILKLRKGGLYTVFQPVIDMQRERVLAYEGLTRFKDKSLRIDEVLRLSYEKGFIMTMDMECLTRALEGFKKIQKDQFLFVNIEPITLCEGFDDKLGKAFLKKAEKYKNRVVFELTEGMKMRDFDRIAEGVTVIRKYGFQFALDDIDGVSSRFLRQLSLHPDFIKIDLGLIMGITENRQNQDIVREIVDIGFKEHCDFVAEGIENVNDLRFMQAMGIRYFQGYYFSPPTEKPDYVFPEELAL